MPRLVREADQGKARVNGRLLREWVPDIVDAIVERFDALQIILFRSVARGDDGPDSPSTSWWCSPRSKTPR